MNVLAMRRALTALLVLVGAVTVLPAGATVSRSDLRFTERLTLTGPGGPLAVPRVPYVVLQLTHAIGEGTQRDLVLAKGEDLIGTDYVYGANGEDALDCSALVQQMYLNAGIPVPRTTRELLRSGSAIDADEAAAGDLMFYRWGPSGLHVAVYLAGERLLHASSRHGGVVVTPINGEWRRRLVAARRLI